MKQLSLLLITFLSFNGFAQNRIESDYVFEGNTFEYTIPKGFKPVEIDDEDFTPFRFYLLDTTNIEQRLTDSEVPPFSSLIMTAYTPKVETVSLQGATEIMERLVEQEYLDIEILEDPVFIKSGNYDIGYAKLFTSELDIPIHTVNLIALDFGEYYFFFAAMSVTPEKEQLCDFLSEQIRNSVKVIETEKENTFEDYYEFMEEFISPYSLGLTRLGRAEITFDAASSYYWTFGGDNGYLAYYDYGHPNESIQGTVILTTAGYETANTADEDLAGLLTGEFQNYSFDTVTYLGDIVGEDFTFRKYSFEGDETTTKAIKRIYTTTYEDELLILLIERTSHTTNYFYTKYEPFIKTLHINFIKED